MANDLIPEPNIQATNIPTGGAPQVSFAPWATPKNTFASLSKTIAGAAQTMVNFNDLEDREADSQKAWKEQLEQIHGLTKTGQLSEADYLKIQREANGKAQKDGIIRAHENWSTIREVDKERSGIRLEALSKNLETSGAINRMSNPNENMASTWGDEQALMLESLGAESLGTDSQGNEVYLDMGNMSPMEMVAFAKGQSALEAAGKAAVETNKAARALEASTARLEARTLTFLDNMDSETPSFADDPLISEGADARKALIIQQFQEEINIAYNEGVLDINAHIFEGLSTFTENIGLDADVRNPSGLDRANELLDVIVGSLMVRDGHRFAEEGTKSFNALETHRANMNTTYAARVKKWRAAEPDREDQFALDIQQFQNDRVSTAEGIATMDSVAEQRSMMRAWRQEAARRGVDFEQHRSSFTTFFDEQVSPIVDEDALTNLFYRMTSNVMTTDTASELSRELFRLQNIGSVSPTEYKSYLEDIVKSRDEAHEGEKAQATEAWESLEKTYSVHIGNYGSNRISDDARQMLAKMSGESSWALTKDSIPSKVTVANISRSRREVLAIMDGGEVPQVAELQKRLEGLDDADPRLDAAVATLAAGLKFDGLLTKDNIDLRHDTATEYVQARMYLETYLQFKKKQAVYDLKASVDGTLDLQDNTK